MLRFGFVVLLLLQSMPFRYSDFSNEISIVRKSFNKNYHTYQLNFTYPELIDRQNQKHIELNLEVQGYMVEAISVFQEKVDMINNKNSFSYLNFDYNVCSNIEEALSLKFIKRSYHPGMNQALELNRTLNFDKRSGKIIHLSDLFLPNLDYERKIIEIINKKFSTCKVPSKMRLTSFCIKEGGLVIVLNKQVLPDDFCSDEVEITWRELQEMLNPESVAYLLANKR